MKHVALLLFVVLAVACTAPAPTVVGFVAPAETLANVDHGHAGPCVFCADVGGKNDLKKLCPASKSAWEAMVTCVCSTSCSPPCSSDWCARLGDANYTNASVACNDCVTASCMPELLTCSSAQ